MKHSIKSIGFLLVSLLTFGILTAGCGSQGADKAQQSIKVGVTAGPHAEVMEVVKKAAAKDGLNIEIVEFNDYVQPNVALVDGEIAANSFQHQPYLDNMVKDRGYDIVSVAKTIIFPMGVYSKKLKSLEELQPGSIIAIPNDPTNGGRALVLLEKLGLLKLKDGMGIKATVNDIAENPKNLKIQELEAAQIPRSLEDLDAAVINTNYAMSAGLVPAKDALAREDNDSPYANVIAVKSDKKDDPVIQKLIKAYQSDEVKDFINEHFQGSAFAAW